MSSFLVAPYLSSSFMIFIIHRSPLVSHHSSAVVSMMFLHSSYLIPILNVTNLCKLWGMQITQTFTLNQGAECASWLDQLGYGGPKEVSCYGEGAGVPTISSAIQPGDGFLNSRAIWTINKPQNQISSLLGDIPKSYGTQEWLQGHFATNLACAASHSRSRGPMELGGISWQTLDGKEPLYFLWF